jgi:hypothetical protein
MTNSPGCFRRALKWIGIGVLVLIVLFLVVVGPWPVNNTPLETSDWYTDSLKSIERAMMEKPTQAPLMQVGIAAIPMNLPLGLPLAGYGARQGIASTGTHDPIRAKAVAFSAGNETAVVVGADILLVNEPLAKAVSEKVATRISRDHLYFMATHTHSGPGGWGTWWAENLVVGAPSDQGQEVLASGMAKAIETALDNIEPATLSFGKTSAPEFVRNRLLDTSPTDPSLQVVKFTGKGGKSLGALISFPAHATVLGADNRLFSAEYPGAVERDLEAAWGGTVVFCAGPLGSMGPKGGGGSGFERVEAIGKGLADKAEALAASHGLRTITGTITFQCNTIPIVSPPVQYRTTQNTRISPVLSAMMLTFNRGVTVTALRIGPLLMLGMPCELSGEIANTLYQVAEKRGLHLIVTSFNGHYQGYVVPDKYFPLDKYETRAMRFLGPHAGSYYEGVLRKIIELEPV